MTVLAALLGALVTAFIMLMIDRRSSRFQYTAEVDRWRGEVRAWANEVIACMKRPETCKILIVAAGYWQVWTSRPYPSMVVRGNTIHYGGPHGKADIHQTR